MLQGRFGAIALVVSIGLMACAPAGLPASERAATEAGGPAATKRIRAAFMSDPPSLMNRINQAVAGGRTSAGVRELENMISIGLTVAEDGGILRPRLAEAVPSVDNGLWRVFPDGRTETTWTIRQGARWHDGAPFTTDDLIFTATVAQDRELPLARDSGYEAIESIHAADPRTVTVRWRHPYILADAMFGGGVLVPRHLLERVYLDDKPGFAFDPYWTTDYVGVGPFKLREYVRNSHLVLEANDLYVLGRPQIDEIEVKFLPDPNALAANILAGAVELTIGQNLTLETALQVGQQWREGRMETSPAGGNPLHIFPQLINPRPAIIGDVTFRRALLHAIDRQELIDSIMGGRAGIAHGVLWDASDREWDEIKGSIVQYDHDPRRATQLIEGLGYTRAADGIARPDSSGRLDASGRDVTGREPSDQRLTVEIRTFSSFDSSVKSLFPIADYWTRVGVAVEPLVVPEQRQADREYRATRPGFDLPRSPRDLIRQHGKETPLPENNFRGNNRARYMNPEFDALIDRYFATIPWTERMGWLRQVAHHMTDQVIVMGLFFDVTPTLVANRLANVKAGPGGTESWNAHEWAVR